MNGRLIIQPTGLLDADGVLTLAGKLRDLLLEDPGEIVVDMSTVTLLLSEGVEPLMGALARVATEEGVPVHLTRLTDSARVQLQLHDCPVRGRTLSFLPSPTKGPPKSNKRHDDHSIIVCRNCESVLRIRSVGLHGCPKCGVHFHADRFGNASFYETLRML